MEYRNTKTGVVITVSSEINGENWERVNAPKTVDTEKLEAPKKTTVKRTK